MKTRPYASTCSISLYRKDGTDPFPVEKGADGGPARSFRPASRAGERRFGAFSLCGLAIWLLMKYDRM